MRKIVIIGAGKTGTSIGYLLQEKGWPVVAVASRTNKSLERARGYLKASLFTLDVTQAAREGEVVFISTRDDVIQEVTEKIASAGGFKKGQFVFHFSGALSTQVLEAARGAGAQVGSMHPMQTLASIETAIKLIPGTVFGVTAEGEAAAVASEIIEALDGEVAQIKDEDKPLYHAAAAIACNYLVALMNTAVKVYSYLGLSEEQSWQALKPLVEGTLVNIESQGTIAALTGPIVRGDVEVVRGHLEALHKTFPELIPLYKEMGKITAEIARKRDLSEEAYRKFQEFFG